VVEATSGNTGIALAMVCAAKGYPFVATMTETFSIERRKIMRALGAKVRVSIAAGSTTSSLVVACRPEQWGDGRLGVAQVILTPAAERGTGMVRKAKELADKHGWFLTSQFTNQANPAYHRMTTGPEIVQDFTGRRLDYWVTGYGTGGTMSGAGQIIKLARPECKVIVTEPAGAALLSGKEWKPHKIQGWTPDFVAENVDRSVYDDIVPVTDEESIDAALALGKHEGILCGISAGGTFAAALKAC
jgi:cysteine synthase A